MTCRQLGYERGLSVCCGAYGYSYDTGVIDKVNCTGNEKSLLNCTAQPPVAACHQDYAAVACYNGQLPSNDGKFPIAAMFIAKKITKKHSMLCRGICYHNIYFTVCL